MMKGGHAAESQSARRHGSENTRNPTAKSRISSLWALLPHRQALMAMTTNANSRAHSQRLPPARCVFGRKQARQRGHQGNCAGQRPTVVLAGRQHRAGAAEERLRQPDRGLVGEKCRRRADAREARARRDRRARRLHGKAARRRRGRKRRNAEQGDRGSSIGDLQKHQGPGKEAANEVLGRLGKRARPPPRNDKTLKRQNADRRPTPAVIHHCIGQGNAVGIIVLGVVAQGPRRRDQEDRVEHENTGHARGQSPPGHDPSPKRHARKHQQDSRRQRVGRGANQAHARANQPAKGRPPRGEEVRVGALPVVDSPPAIQVRRLIDNRLKLRTAPRNPDRGDRSKQAGKAGRPRPAIGPVGNWPETRLPPSRSWQKPCEKESSLQMVLPCGSRCPAATGLQNTIAV